MYRVILILLLSLTTYPAIAWNRSVELGYGYSHDPNGSKYHNSGVFLSGELYPLRRSIWTFWSINGALGQWHTTAPFNKDLTTAALSLSIRFYPFTMMHTYPTYLFGSAGPAVLSNRKFGVNEQASHLTIQTNLGLGIETKKYDFNLRLVHYSNADLAHPNEGFNILYLFSIGYLF